MKFRAKLVAWPAFFLVILIICALHFNGHPALVKENPKHQAGENALKTTTVVDSRNLTSSSSPKTVETSMDDELSFMLQPFQSAEEAEFPISANTIPRIPHIIHQIFCEDTVPEPYKGFIETYIEQNPKWEYRFWSHESGRKLLVDRFLQLVRIFDRFGHCDERRTNILKYAVLHEFGGVYSDLDMENKRPLDNATFKYACILPIEPFEDAAMRFQTQLDIFNFNVLKDTYTHPQLQTGIMLCRANHPFIWKCLEGLEINAVIGDASFIGGPVFITNWFMAYNNLTENDIKKQIANPISNSPYFYKGERAEDGNDTVYIPNSQYFYDSVDPLYLNEKTRNLNRCWHYNESDYLSLMGKRACAEFERRRELRKNLKYAFVVHHFHNSRFYDLDKWTKDMKKIHIRKVVPNCILYDRNAHKKKTDPIRNTTVPDPI